MKKGGATKWRRQGLSREDAKSVKTPWCRVVLLFSIVFRVPHTQGIPVFMRNISVGLCKILTDGRRFYIH